MIVSATLSSPTEQEPRGRFGQQGRAHSMRYKEYIRKYRFLSAGVVVGFRYAINSEKEKHCFPAGVYCTEGKGIKCSKKDSG